MKKLRSAGDPLKTYGEIHRGLITGFNKAFEVDEKKRQELIEEDPRSAEVIRPWIRGRNIAKWKIQWGGKYIIAIQNGGDPDANNPWSDAQNEERARQIFRATYPAIHRHLSQWEERLKKRWDQGEFWWELRACQYYSEFEKPKIVYQEIATHQAFTYSKEPLLMNNKCFFIPTDDLYLLAILNSSVGWFFLGHTVSKLQRGAYAMQSPYVSQVPIPTPTEAQRDAIETLVRQLLDVEGEGPQACPERSRRTGEWERALNAHVYEVYDLTPAEIALIEEATADGA
jgi:hypothetical protein